MIFLLIWYDKCPQCKKELKTLGVDYKIMSSVFICNNCTEKFSDLEMIFNRINYGNKFEFIDANWPIVQHLSG